MPRPTCTCLTFPLPKQGAHVAQERQHLQHQLAELLEPQAQAVAELAAGVPGYQAQEEAQRWLQVRAASAVCALSVHESRIISTSVLIFT